MEELKIKLSNLPGEDDNFKCDICNNYLSISPILFNESIGYICGRCHKEGETEKYDSSVIFQIQSLYEKVAKYMIFPCRHSVNGCKKDLKWNEVQEHEDVSCEFKEIRCPFSVQFQIKYTEESYCAWEGKTSEFVNHLIENHNNYSSENLELVISRTESCGNRIFFSKIMESFVIVIMRYEETSGQYYFNIFMNASHTICKGYYYDVELLDEHEIKSIVLPGNNIKPVSILYSKNALEIEMESIHKLLKKPDKIIFRCKIYKIQGDKVELFNKNGDKAIKTPQKSDIIGGILPELKCFCGNLLYPPIRVCLNGHNCCVNCKQNITHCSQCNNTFLPGSNTTLEVLSLLPKYPCRNKVLGCGFEADCTTLQDHEYNCIFTEKNCILKCNNWKGTNTEMLAHIRSNHSFLNLNQVYTYDSKSKYSAIWFDNKLFLLTIDFKGIGNSLLIKLQCLGMVRAEYKYEFTLLNSYENIKLIMYHICQPLLYEAPQKKLEHQPQITKTEQTPIDFVPSTLNSFGSVTGTSATSCATGIFNFSKRTERFPTTFNLRILPQKSILGFFLKLVI
ncbi:hypothetical protein HHI36_019067 [Cryptolaemus montrouzieri]|uniref:RING-type E3 ubiquitin transferase n=1 Tax=Cryptolaemus montrouzieri TaxID=559131 RepID=A0ABD2P1V7_9CUCU